MRVLVQATTKGGEHRSAVVAGDWHKGLGEGSFVRESLVPGLQALRLVDEDVLAWQATVIEDESEHTITVYSDHISIDGAGPEDGPRSAHFGYAFDVYAPGDMLGDDARHVMTDAMVHGGALRVRRDG